MSLRSGLPQDVLLDQRVQRSESGHSLKSFRWKNRAGNRPQALDRQSEL